MSIILENTNLASSQFTAWLKEIETKRDTLLRMAIFGNAGGVIATLSFIGTIVGRAGKFDRVAFFVLCFFLLGLAGGWIGRIVQWRIAEIRVERREQTFDGDGWHLYPGETRGWERMLAGVLIFCYSMLIGGILSGLRNLYALVGP